MKAEKFRKSKSLLEEFKRDLARDTAESNYVKGKLEHQRNIEFWALNFKNICVGMFYWKI